ncbi:D-TA family PLP-dependent enzyme [Flavobacteriaceae bacterium]|jgi:D-serine deaminase-like pyridoxal phosphate-dependent protein|nr:D-TA family PLP-dependent enzyme [Flavobacteriaceae bacterium]
MSEIQWYRAKDETQLITPGLLIYPDRVKHNIESMIEVAGDVNRLIPHVKTYKMQAIVKLQMGYGIKEFKCATIGELQMLIACGVQHILLAIQPTKAKVIRILDAQQKHPEISFSTLVDNSDSLTLFSTLAKACNQQLNLWLDINNGMNRTGIVPEFAKALYMQLFQDPNLNAMGLHVYDGHIRPIELQKRVDQCNSDFQSIEQLINAIQKEGGIVPEHITGGSPSFYPHSLRKTNRLSPGTTLLWDLGYQKIWQESPFLHAAVLVTRLISKPNTNIFCFDLGHKAVASEMPLPRVEIFGLEGAVHKGQSEEHLIVEYHKPNDFKIGDLFYAIPYHICPTVAKYSKAYTLKDGELGSFWEIEARDYQA